MARRGRQRRAPGVTPAIEDGEYSAAAGQKSARRPTSAGTDGDDSQGTARVRLLRSPGQEPPDVSGLQGGLDDDPQKILGSVSSTTA